MGELYSCGFFSVHKEEYYMIICSVNQLGKMYGGNIIFENVSFEIKQGEKVGLVGRNGSGKTTLFQLLAGRDTPDSGMISWKKGTKISLLEQIPSADPNLSVNDLLKQAFHDLIKVEEKMKQLEKEMSIVSDQKQLVKLMAEYGNLTDYFSLHGGYEIDAMIEKVVHGLNIAHLVEKPFSMLSGGEKTKIGLAVNLLKHPDFLLLDEPTNHLDLQAIEWLSEFLENYHGTVVVISHDRYFLDEVVGKILDLEDGEIKSYQTNFSGYIKEKQAELLREFQAYEEQQKKIKKMKEAIKRLKEWANAANPPNEGLHKRARNMERALERMEKLKKPNVNPKKINLTIEAANRSGKDVVSLHEVSKKFDNRVLFSNVNMHIYYQDRVAIVGENGTGKSTLLKMILGEVTPDFGEVKVGSSVKIGYLSQHVFADTKEGTVIDEFRKIVKVTEGEARNLLSRFLFFGPSVYKKIEQLSGGEKMRLRLAQLMYQELNFLILDEPTNHLDIESREVLEEALEDFSGTILAVSHDRYFLNKLFNKIYWIDEQKVHFFSGDYNYARAKWMERKRQNNTVQNIKKEKPERKKAEPIFVKKEVNIEMEIETVEQSILEIEENLGRIESLEELQILYAQKEKLEKKWSELVSKL